MLFSGCSTKYLRVTLESSWSVFREPAIPNIRILAHTRRQAPENPSAPAHTQSSFSVCQLGCGARSLLRQGGSQLHFHGGKICADREIRVSPGAPAGRGKGAFRALCDLRGYVPFGSALSATSLGKAAIRPKAALSSFAGG